MSRLCGWAGNCSGNTDPRTVIQAMAAACRAPAGAEPSARIGPMGALAALEPSVFQEDGKLAAVCGHMMFADRELSRIAGTRGAAAALIHAWAAHGPDAVKLLRGDFAVAVLDDRSGEALLAIDRMGVHSLTYAQAGPCLVFGTVSDAVNRHPSVRAELDPQALYNYVYFHMVPGPGTVYQGQRRLPPGHLLHFSRGVARIAPYWEMRFTEDNRQPFAELKQEFMETLRDAVRGTADKARAGAFLSGGTDSSTVAGLLGEVRGEPADTFSIGFDQEGYDEMEYARIAATHFKTRHHEYYVTPADVAAAIPDIAAVHDQPFGNASAVPTYYCARLARSHGVERLLGGDGGDELFGGNERYATQHLFALYDRVPRVLRERVLEPLLRAFPAGKHVMPVRKARSYVLQAQVPMPDRLQAYNLVERLGGERIFSTEFLEGVDCDRPLALLRQSYHGAQARSMINRMLALDRQFTLADNDLPKVTRSCELAGVDAAFPLLDDRLVDFSCRLEPRLKLKGTRLRYFFKEALRDFLPAQIITKTKHGFGLPFGHWLRSDRGLQEIVHGSLESLRARRIVRPALIDELVDVRMVEHAGYYGTMIWVLMMLELWFQKQPATTVHH